MQENRTSQRNSLPPGFHMEASIGLWLTTMSLLVQSSSTPSTFFQAWGRSTPRETLACLRLVRLLFEQKQVNLLKPKLQTTSGSSPQKLQMELSLQRPHRLHMRPILDVSVVLPRNEDGSLCLGLSRAAYPGMQTSTPNGRTLGTLKADSQLVCLPGPTLTSTRRGGSILKYFDSKPCTHGSRVFSTRDVEPSLYRPWVLSFGSSGTPFM